MAQHKLTTGQLSTLKEEIENLQGGRYFTLNTNGKAVTLQKRGTDKIKFNEVLVATAPDGSKETVYLTRVHSAKLNGKELTF